MLTSAPTKKQIEEWKRVFREKGAFLKPNRISGKQLDSYFREKYSPKREDIDSLKEAIYLNKTEQDGDIPKDISHIVTYVVNDDIYVGIDLYSGFFQVECEEISRMSSVYDDLFLTRGLDEKDLQNFFLTAQYIQLIEK
ncbi:MAG: hypothetical protein ACI4II_02955 [Acutalibacteraceae bacterium]